VRHISGIPFEYVFNVGADPTTGLKVVTRRDPDRSQRFTPPVKAALTQFVSNMARFGMRIETILTAGSIYCRCISNTNTLSNHSFGDAIDVVGVRWAVNPGSRLRETIVHNYLDPAERVLLRRMNACLRLSFATVIDYHRSDHRDHFHCDTNLGRGRKPRGSTTLFFVQEALNARGASLRINGNFDGPTQQALAQYAGVPVSAFANAAQLNAVLDRLFTDVASRP
jgi:hypothetical protein